MDQTMGSSPAIFLPVLANKSEESMRRCTSVSARKYSASSTVACNSTESASL